MRPLTAADRPALERATCENLNRMGRRFTLEDVRREPQFRHYFEAWPGPADLGFADVDDTGRIRGLVWLILFGTDDPGYGFVGPDIPELSVWVAQEHRGRGVGGALVAAVCDEARARGWRALSLSVEAGNPARRLYERVGFRPAGPAFDDGTLLLDLRWVR